MTDKFYTYVSKFGNTIIERGYEEGKDFTRKIYDFKPYLYTTTNTETKEKGIDGKNLMKVEFADSNDMRDYQQRYKDVDDHHVYGIRDVVTQYLTKEYPGDITGNLSVVKGNILDIEVFSGHLDKETDKFVFDGFPEPEKADKPVNAITFYNTITQKFMVYGLEELEGKCIGTFDNTFDDVVYKGFKSEKDLLVSFLSDYSIEEFHFISGWYVEFFDIAYLTKRVKDMLGVTNSKKLSPLGSIREKTYQSYGKDKLTYKWIGTTTLDYIDCYKKFNIGYKPKNWKLNTVAKDTIKDQKVAYEGSLQNLYLSDYQTFIEYNIYDVRLIVEMEKKNNFFQQAYSLAHLMNSSVEDIFATVRPWTQLMFKSLKEENVYPRLKGVSKNLYPFIGGYVKEPIVGFHKWVCSFDVNSMHPHQLQGYNMGQETLIEYKDLPLELKEIHKQFAIPHESRYLDKDHPEGIQSIANRNTRKFINKEVDLSCLKKYDVCIDNTGRFYSRKGISLFNRMTRKIYDLRVVARQELAILKKAKSTDTARMTQLQNVQMSYKLMINSLYGAIANEYFTEYFDIRIAESVTANSQREVQFAADRINKYLNTMCETSGVEYAFYTDTDSVYLTLDNIVNKLFKEKATLKESEPKIIEFLDRFCSTRLQKVIDDAFIELAEYTNAKDQRMVMKREAICVSGIWTAKKRYVLLLADLEGIRYDEYKIKYVGLEAIRSTYPLLCQEGLIDCYELLLTKNTDMIRQFVVDFKKIFMESPLEMIATTTSVQDISKYTDSNGKPRKGTPNQVKAAINHNKLIELFRLVETRPINDGDKVQVLPLIRNKYAIDECAFNGLFPKEFKLESFVDKEAMFDKNFLKPLQTICHVCGLPDIMKKSRTKALF